MSHSQDLASNCTAHLHDEQLWGGPDGTKKPRTALFPYSGFIMWDAVVWILEGREPEHQLRLPNFQLVQSVHSCE